MINVFFSLLRSVFLPLFVFSVTHAAHAAPKVGDRFGDWVFGCMALAEGKTACALTQTIVSKKDNRRIVKFSLAHNEKKGALVLTAVLPLGIHLPSGASGAIDQGRAFQYTLETCLQFGCIATYAVDGSFLKAMQSGQKLNINFSFNGGKQPVAIAGSLSGLAEGLKVSNLN